MDSESHNTGPRNRSGDHLALQGSPVREDVCDPIGSVGIDPNGDGQNGYAVGIIPACVSNLHNLAQRDLADHEQRLVSHTAILWVRSFLETKLRVTTDSRDVSL